MNYMDYQSFLNYIENYIRDYLEDIEVSEISVIQHTKNNNTVRDELCIKTDEGRFGTVIDLVPFYDRFIDGTSMETILEEISDIFFQNMVFPSDFDCNTLDDFDQIKDKIYLKVVNYEANKRMLQKMPHKRLLDLAITYRIEIPSKINTLLSLNIDDALFSMWNISEENMDYIAKQNTIRDYPILIGKIEEELFGCDDSMLYVLTNESYYNGAVMIAFPEIIKEIANGLNDNLFILPSSIHELMLVKASEVEKPDELKFIVREVNTEVVNEVEILGESIYFYGRDEDKLEIYA